MNIIIADVETTGILPPIGIVEVAWLKLAYNEKHFEYYIDESSITQCLVNPEMPISEAASAVNGIRNEDITDDLPKIHEVEFPKEPCLFVSHNVVFDRPLLEPYLNIQDELCTLILSRRLIPSAENHKLGTLAVHCNLSRKLSHRAESDIIHCAELLMHIMKKYNLDIHKALYYYKKPFVYSYMPWGKHKGVPMSEVPRGYMNWLRDQDLDRDMRTTVEYWMQR